MGGSLEVLLHQHPHKLAAGQPSQPHQAVVEPEVPAGSWVTASEFNAECSQEEPSVCASVLADRLQCCLPAVPELRLQPVQPEDLVSASEVLACGKQLSASLHLSQFKRLLRRESAGLKLMLQEAAAEQPPSTPRSRMPAAGRGLAVLTSPLSSGRKAAPAAVRPSAPPSLLAECLQAEQGSGTAAGGPVEPGATRMPALKRAAAPMLGGKPKAKVAKLPGKAAGIGRAAGTGNAAGAGRQAGASKAAAIRKRASQLPASTGGRPALQQLATAISGGSIAAAPAANADIDGSAKKSPPAPAKPRAKAADIDLAQTEVKLKEKQAAGKLGELSIPQLKVLLKARKLPLGGKKADLITRLQGHLAGSQA